MCASCHMDIMDIMSHHVISCHVTSCHMSHGQYLLLHLYESSLEDEDPSPTVGGGDSHYPRSYHLHTKQINLNGSTSQHS